jgi:hypothetical protein
MGVMTNAVNMANQEQALKLDSIIENHIRAVGGLSAQAGNFLRMPGPPHQLHPLAQGLYYTVLKINSMVCTSLNRTVTNWNWLKTR